MIHKKIQTQAELFDTIKEEKALGKKIGFTNGCFDILHAGHVKYLNEAKKECDVLIVGVNSDSSVRIIKGEKRPINNQNDRMEVLSAIECIDFITLFEEDTPQKLIEKLTPDVLFKGGDWKENDIAGSDYVKSNGGKVKIIPYAEGYSTTNIIKKMKNKE